MSTEETIAFLAAQAQRCEAMWNRPLEIARALLSTTRLDDTPMPGGRRNVDPLADAS